MLLDSENQGGALAELVVPCPMLQGQDRRKRVRRFISRPLLILVTLPIRRPPNFSSFAYVQNG